MVKKKVIEAPDLAPSESFQVELVDKDQKPIVKARLKASLDGAPAKPVKSDSSGIIKVKIEPTTTYVALHSADES